jgi:hypothetical protein
MFRQPARIGVLCACMLSAAGAYAQDSGSMPWEKGSLQVGGFISYTNSELRLDSPTLGIGTVVDLEDALGLDSDVSSYRLDGLYRLGSSRRHQVEVHYYVSDRDGSKVTDRALQIGDLVIPAGTGVTSNLDMWFLNVDYSYAFLQDDRVRLAGAIGLHTTNIDFSIATSGGSVEEEAITAPLPVVGVRGEVVLTERWRMKGSVDLFYLEYDNFTGGLADTFLGVEYLPTKHVGFGLGINSVRLKVEADSDDTDYPVDFTGKVKFDFTGLLLYVKGYF